MIVDTIENLKQYRCIRGIGRVMDFLSANNPASIKEAQVAIDGEDLFVKVIRYPLKAEKPEFFETHNNYADLQFIVEGHEIMEYAVQENLEEAGGYNAASDVQFFRAERAISGFVVKSDMFALFLPKEAHRPGCPDGNSGEQVFKLVFKIRI